ncbi:pentapeptide repeat-containing protein [Candidatus Neomarinimicrobiota bacterium]
MSSNEPQGLDDEMYRLLREEKVEEFNARRSAGEVCQFRGVDFRGVVFREADVHGIDFSDCYFRQADLRGLDMSTCHLEGASLREAKISGAYFPKELAADEIMMSLTYGTRVRYR